MMHEMADVLRQTVSAPGNVRRANAYGIKAMCAAKDVAERTLHAALDRHEAKLKAAPRVASMQGRFRR